LRGGAFAAAGDGSMSSSENTMTPSFSTRGTRRLAMPPPPPAAAAVPRPPLLRLVSDGENGDTSTTFFGGANLRGVEMRVVWGDGTLHRQHARAQAVPQRCKS
jgi:hypothetical protein